MIRIPEKVIFCDGVQVLLNGCVETRNCQLLQNAVTVCLYHLNNSQFRQNKTILDLQVSICVLISFRIVFKYTMDVVIHYYYYYPY